MNRILSVAVCSTLALGAVEARAANLLFYGPSLAPQNCGQPDLAPLQHPHASLGGCDTIGAGLPLVNESTVAADNGHAVTIVDEAGWSSMTAPQFAAFDAIVIGDAGCDFSNGEEMATLDANKAVWSPVVTGNIVVNGFDAFFHYYQSATVTAGARALAGSGMNYAASGNGTGLYFSNGCRDYDGGGPAATEGGGLVTLDFLSLLGTFQIDSGGGGDEIAILAPAHPAIAGGTSENLSFWGTSTHTTFTQTPGLEELAETTDEGGPDATLGGGTIGTVALATPVGQGGPSILEIPTLSHVALAALALALALAATARLRRA